mmetsp:Transcript_51392/g.132606  ORF Transcript_51392/g.132606 Transcript_51392/m.132606 type:complete len:229 (-) Transcript_51392:694-1380(-)
MPPSCSSCSSVAVGGSSLVIPNWRFIRSKNKSVRRMFSFLGAAVLSWVSASTLSAFATVTSGGGSTAASSPSASAAVATSPSWDETSPSGSVGGRSTPWRPVGDVMESRSLGSGSSSLSSPFEDRWDCRGTLPRGASDAVSPLTDAPLPAASAGNSSILLKYLRVFVPMSSMFAGGSPRTSTMRQTWSYSDWPGKIGRPKKSSAQMQPRLHMSMALVYGRPSKTSGER